MQSTKRFILAAAMMAAFSGAHAGSLIGDTTNNHGGQGGAGGAVIGSGNSAQQQGQAQGQAQGQSQVAKGGKASANASGGNSNATGGYAAGGQGGNAQGGQGGSASSGGNSISVQGDNYDTPKIPVSTAYAPNIAPTAMCMGAFSASVQAHFIGIAGGSSFTDDNCVKLEQVRTIGAVLGDKELAAEIMCDFPAVKAARERLGRPCAGTPVAAASTPTVAVAPADVRPLAAASAERPTRVASLPAAPSPVVSPVPPKVERYRITTDGLRAVN